MALRRGVAVGGDRDLLPAAPGAARARRAADAVAHAGALRPARGARRTGSMPRLPARRAAGVAPTRRRGRAGGGGGSGGARARARRRRLRARALGRLSGDLLAALRPYAAWTSAATHAVLPLLATDAGVRLQVRTGVASHRARFGAWRGGFWLPECAYAPWLHPLLAEAGVRAVCVDLTDVLGRGDARELRPIATEGGPLLVPIDRATVELVWSDAGYPAHGAYRDYHRRTARDHRPWANDGRVYDAARAAARARADAADFVARVRERVAGGGL